MISRIFVYVCVHNILTSFHYRIECKSRKPSKGDYLLPYMSQF